VEIMGKFEIDASGKVIFTDGKVGAILLDDELWYPFSYFVTGEYDFFEDHGGFMKPSSAYKMAKLKYT
jgi:hypothetical protein